MGQVSLTGERQVYYHLTGSYFAIWIEVVVGQGEVEGGAFLVPILLSRSHERGQTVEYL
jgi:hypothetical protein